MPRVQMRRVELSTLRTVQARRAVREKELGPHMIATVANSHTQVVWQKDDEGAPEKAILVTNYETSGVIEIKQGTAEILVNHESVPELVKAMKDVKGMHD